jgi:hypothetical protein
MEIADGFPCLFFIYFLPFEAMTVPITNHFAQTDSGFENATMNARVDEGAIAGPMHAEHNLKHDGEIKARTAWNSQ